MSDLVDLAVMRELAAGCGWGLDELATRYLREARAGLAALEQTRSVPEARRVAHGLRGAGATVGVTGMADVLRRIEENDRPSEIGLLARRAGAQLARVEAALRQAVATDSGA